MKKLIKTFDYSNTNWGTIPVTNYYTNLQGYELEFLIKNLGELKKIRNLKVLDLGCGGGNVCGFLKKKFPNWDIYGIDISKKAIGTAKKNYKDIKFKVSTADNLPFKDGEFDLILSLDTLEHFVNYKKVIIEVRRVLKQDRYFYLAVPLEKQFPTPLYFFYKFGWTGKNEFVGHVNYFDNKTIISDFKNLGFINTKKTFAGYLIYFIGDILYYLLLKPKNGKDVTFETSVQNSYLRFIKSVFSTVTYFESKIFNFLPGGRGHYFLKKTDFFSVNAPYTVCENLQIKHDLEKVVRPKDLYIKNYILKHWKFKEGQIILDFGCSNGLWLERLIKFTKLKGIGIDVSNTLIEFARRRKKKKGTYLISDAKWPIKNNYIDYTVSFDVFEHIKNRKKEVKNIYGSVKPGGKFLFYTLNPNNKYTFDWFFEKLGSNYLYKRADHNKKLFPNPKVFKKELENVGFKNVGYEYFDGPFNLFWEVFTYTYLKILPFKFVYFLNDLFIKSIYKINISLDKITISKGFSNGYFIWGEK